MVARRILNAEIGQAQLAQAGRLDADILHSRLSRLHGRVADRACPRGTGPLKRRLQRGQRMTATSRRLSRHTLPPLQDFSDVLVQRHEGRTNPGALWPDFDHQYHARHLNGGLPVCLRPGTVSHPAETVEQPHMFVGPHDGHFGHFVAEIAPRLPQTLAERPDLPLVFTARMPQTAQTAAPALMAVLNWFGVAPERLRFVHQPTLFRRLGVAAQGEHLGGPGPASAYLDLIESHTARHDLPGQRQDVVYVSRARLPGQLGAHAGESYLCDCLTRLGVQVIHPEVLPLRDQMAAYAGARVLVFAEGSAVHGRQLLGRIDQDVVVLLRRPESQIALNALLPRCASVELAAAAGNELHFLRADGLRWPHSTVAFYDVPVLLDLFGRIGVPLSRIWSEDDHARARDARVLDWLRAIHAPRVAPWLRPWNPAAYVMAQLERLGLDHLRSDAAAIIGGGAAAQWQG
jgi:hypothetical protein